MLLNNYLPSYLGLILVIVMIFFGQAFRANWKNKNDKWVLKAWIYGLISSSSFIVIALVPLDAYIELLFCAFFRQSNLEINGLLGSISLLQTRHLSDLDRAFSPPQLPLIFFPISITPRDIRPTNTDKIMNVIMNVVIYFDYL